MKTGRTLAREQALRVPTTSSALIAAGVLIHAHGIRGVLVDVDLHQRITFTVPPAYGPAATRYALVDHLARLTGAGRHGQTHWQVYVAHGTLAGHETVAITPAVS